MPEKASYCPGPYEGFGNLESGPSPPMRNWSRSARRILFLPVPFPGVAEKRLVGDNDPGLVLKAVEQLRIEFVEKTVRAHPERRSVGEGVAERLLVSRTCFTAGASIRGGRPTGQIALTPDRPFGFYPGNGPFQDLGEGNEDRESVARSPGGQALRESGSALEFFVQ